MEQQLTVSKTRKSRRDANTLLIVQTTTCCFHRLFWIHLIVLDGGCALRILRKLSYTYAETHDIAVELSLERLKMIVGLAMKREPKKRSIDYPGSCSFYEFISLPSLVIWKSFWRKCSFLCELLWKALCTDPVLHSWGS
jgi:hypothetical protein